MGINPSRNVKVWCQSEITDNIDLIVQAVALGVLIILGCFMAYYNEAQKYSSLYRALVDKKAIVFKTIISIIIYSVFMQQQVEKQQAQQIIKNQMILVGIYLIGDSLTTFFLLTAMITIPCQWLCFILKKIQFEKATTLIISGQYPAIIDQIKQRKFINRCFFIFHCLSIYRKIRLIIILVCIMYGISQIYWDEEDLLRQFHLIYRLIPITETILVSLIYGFGFYILQRLKLLLTHLDQQDFKKIKFQYFILLVCALARLGYNLLFFIDLPYQYIPNKYCLNISDSWATFHSLSIALGLFFMHIFPVSVIIAIYWQGNANPQQEKRRPLLSQSI